MEISKWDALSFLKCHIDESRLSFGSISLDIDPDLICLCGYCLVFLFLCYLVGIPSLFTGWKTTERRKCSAKRRRKGGTLTGWSYCQSDTEEEADCFSGKFPGPETCYHPLSPTIVSRPLL
ncbi:spermatogenesis-associated protein 31D1-like [Talpa occidentalis]|uniref:spermatogenesis-associated protein 31D1-like n=1 Tax=Talpa occidentalis TaxID=50954 RepID=UPI001890900B|nr:spermatogenesis-associated protein 31D1-like [Talpa occidentalis]